MVRLTSLALAVASFLPVALSAAIEVRQDARRAVLGEWSAIIKLPVIPISAYVVPRYPQPNKLLVFAAYRKDSFGGEAGVTQFADINLDTGAVSAREVDESRHDMFCPGMSQLGDGRIIIHGGSNSESTSLYNPATNTFKRGGNLKQARGYQSSATLGNGKVFTIGGAWSGGTFAKDGEIYDPATDSWTALPGANADPMLTGDREGVFRADNHAWLVSWKNSTVFQAGPSKNQNWYYTWGTGSVQAAGTRDTVDSMCAAWVLYDAVRGRIFSAGGTPSYQNSDATPRAHITTIGEVGRPSSVRRVKDMSFPRAFSNGVVLPNGKILITGGQRRAILFKDTDSTQIPELYDPDNDTWTQLAREGVPRTYHSVSILLPDGRVFSGGGGACLVMPGQTSPENCDRTQDHLDGQIFSPPYLFKADGSPATRPAISGLAQTAVKPGATLTFKVTGATLGSLSLIRMGSVTHSVNTDQRRVPLEGYQVGTDGTVTARLPGSHGILTPGFWYLFAVSTSGVPSLAKSVHVIP